jgi:hypothetical protein
MKLTNNIPEKKSYPKPKEKNKVSKRTKLKEITKSRINLPIFSTRL